MPILIPSTSVVAPTESLRLPLNLGLNDGTYAPQACVDVLKQFADRTSFRNYSNASHDELRHALAKIDDVDSENIFLHNGTGPILKLAIPFLVRQRILASPVRIARHLLSGNGYPLITPSLTYSKIPRKAKEAGLRVHFLPLSPTSGFQLDLDRLESTLKQHPGVVYLVNPNNPTGNILILREQLIRLLERYPQSRFWIDEAYVQYLDPREFPNFSNLVPRFSNLLVSRSFSFAYGLAAARIGYLLASKSFVRELESKLTDYRLGSVQEQLALAAIHDAEHLSFIRETNTQAVNYLRTEINKFPGLETAPSHANFVLCRFTDSRTGAWLSKQLLDRQIRIKTFEAHGSLRFDSYFRITTGLPEENRYLVEQLKQLLHPSTLPGPSI